MLQQLFENLTSGDAVITANRRLAAYLYEHHSAWQQQNPVNHWVTPTILPLSSWLEQLWQTNQLKAHFQFAKPQFLDDFYNDSQKFLTSLRFPSDLPRAKWLRP